MKDLKALAFWGLLLVFAIAMGVLVALLPGCATVRTFNPQTGELEAEVTGYRGELRYVATSPARCSGSGADL